MSNHLHVVIQVLPEATNDWSDREQVELWVRRFPKEDITPDLRADIQAQHGDRIGLLRSRLGDLSWIMRCRSKQGARRKLRMRNTSTSLNDLRIPADNRLEALKSRCRGQHTIRISDHWGICFQWKANNALNVEIDYH